MVSDVSYFLVMSVVSDGLVYIQYLSCYVLILYLNLHEQPFDEHDAYLFYVNMASDIALFIPVML